MTLGQTPSPLSLKYWNGLVLVLETKNMNRIRGIILAIRIRMRDEELKRITHNITFLTFFFPALTSIGDAPASALHCSILLCIRMVLGLPVSHTDAS